MTTMQRVLLCGAIALFALCSGSGLLLYYRGLPEIDVISGESIENEVAFQVQRSMENALVMHQNLPCSVTLRGDDLDISTYTDTTGNTSVQIVNGEATIQNGDVDISTNGVDIYIADMHLHAMPVVEANLFALDETDIDRGLVGYLISGSSLETGFERGVNEGLHRAHLRPISVALTEEAMIIGCIAEGATS